MVINILLLLFSVFFCRAMHTSYRSGTSKEYCVVIKNNVISKILIDGWQPFEKKDSLKRDRNKLSFYGLIFYCLNAIALILFIILLILPEFPCNLYEISINDSSFVIKTYNTLIPLVFSVFICLLEIAVFSLRLIPILNSVQYAAVKWFCIIVLFITVLLCILVGAWVTVSLF